MAKYISVPVTIYVPGFMNEYTRNLIRGEGADLQVLEDGSYDETIAEALPISNRLKGHVQLVEYVGRAYEALVRLEGETGAQLLAHSDHAPASGAEIEVSIRPERLLLFSEETTDESESILQSGIIDAPEPTVGVER